MYIYKYISLTYLPTRKNRADPVISVPPLRTPKAVIGLFSSCKHTYGNFRLVLNALSHPKPSILLYQNKHSAVPNTLSYPILSHPISPHHQLQPQTTHANHVPTLKKLLAVSNHSTTIYTCLYPSIDSL